MRARVRLPAGPSLVFVRALVRTFVFGVVMASFVAGTARAQEPAGAPVGTPGLRIVSGQSAIIGGNGAGARERALEEAFRQAIDQSLAELLDAATRAGQARSVKALEARARTYVRRYRALEEGELNGTYSVKLEVEVDEAALRRATESWGQGTAAPAAPAVVPGVLLVAGGTPQGTPEGTSLLLAALVAAGARAQVADPAVKDVAEAQRAATRAGLPQVAFVTAQSAGEGPVRGTTKVSVSCRVAARVVSAPSGLALGEPDASPRAFADDEGAARADCLTRAAGEVAARLVSPGGSPAAAGGDLRTLTVEADVTEPGAVVALLKNVRAVGSVSSAELRRVEAGHAEIRARTRALATALAPALSRDPALTLSNVEVAGDVIRLRARLRPPVTP
jgi:hypothetical protein